MWWDEKAMPNETDIQAPSAEPGANTPGFQRLEKIRIQNYKVIDDLELEFPAPQYDDEADIFVIGSKNGYGKTSVLEAICFWDFFPKLRSDNYSINDYEYFYARVKEQIIDPKFSNLINRSGTNECIIISSDKKRVPIILPRFGIDYISEQYNIKTKDPYEYSKYWSLAYNSIFGFEPSFYNGNNVLFFNSNRKIPEGDIDLTELTANTKNGSKTNKNEFKYEVLNLLMTKKELFEGKDFKTAEIKLDKLNDLARQYTGGYINKLQDLQNGKAGIRITPVDGSGSFPFDSLSSGQKDMIYMLYFIWSITKDNPRIVLIDEPELHMNAEWHRTFMSALYNIAPQNQYIIATHSEDVFDSVFPYRRVIISK